MVTSALHSQTRTTTTLRPPQGPPLAIHAGPWAFTGKLPGKSTSAAPSLAYGSFDLVRKFLEHLVLENAVENHSRVGSGQSEIDWAAVEASTSDCQTLEQAIGRAVVVADQMSRGVFDGMERADLWPSYDANDPFFAFSVTDVAPDFGDESRYRKRVARKVVGILGTRRRLVTT